LFDDPGAVLVPLPSVELDHEVPSLARVLSGKRMMPGYFKFAMVVVVVVVAESERTGLPLWTLFAGMRLRTRPWKRRSKGRVERRMPSQRAWSQLLRACCIIYTKSTAWPWRALHPEEWRWSARRLPRVPVSSQSAPHRGWRAFLAGWRANNRRCRHGSIVEGLGESQWWLGACAPLLRGA
jgi:hypothetical protein